MRRGPTVGRTAALLVLAVLSAACGSEKKKEAGPAGAATDEARALAAARPFLDAIAVQDHAKAYGLAAGQLRALLTLEAFAQKNRAAFAAFGTPLRIDALGADTDPALLAGAANATGDDELEKAANRVLSEVALGDTPDSLPASIRRASVSANVVFGKAEEPDGTDPFYVLTVVLVDDAGEWRVGHHFFREATMLDD